MASNHVHAYVRVSRDGQTTEQQRLAIRQEYPADTVFNWYEETSSAWDDRRSEWATLVKNIERGRVKEVCSCSIDRLGRNTRRAFYFIDLCIAKGVKLKTLSQNIDWYGPFGRALFTFFAEIAQMESDNKSDRIKRKFEQQKKDKTFIAHGCPPGTVSEHVKAQAEEVYNMLDNRKSYRYIADRLHISVNSVEKLVALRGKPLLTRKEFAKKYPGWHLLPQDKLYAMIGLPLPPPKPAKEGK